MDLIADDDRLVTCTDCYHMVPQSCIVFEEKQSDRTIRECRWCEKRKAKETHERLLASGWKVSERLLAEQKARNTHETD